MPCCKEVQLVHMEDLKASAVNFGFDEAALAELVKKFGPDILSIAVEAARNGFTPTLILEILMKFGPGVLELLLNIFKKQNAKFGEVITGDVITGDQVNTIDISLVETLLQKYVPLLMEKYGDQIIQAMLEWIINHFLKK